MNYQQCSQFRQEMMMNQVRKNGDFTTIAG